jgi:hypothetical protein
MNRIKFFSAIALLGLIGSGMFNACQKKEENLVYRENNLYMQKQQKWDPDKDSYFILKEDDAPFQYAVHEEDLNNLLDYAMLVLKEQKVDEKPGYFILSSNTTKGLIYYGFLTEKSPYYNPDIFIDNPDVTFINLDDINEEDYEMMYGCNPNKGITTRNENRARRWAERQLKNGYEVKVTPVDGWYIVDAKKNCG